MKKTIYIADGFKVSINVDGSVRTVNVPLELPEISYGNSKTIGLLFPEMDNITQINYFDTAICKKNDRIKEFLFGVGFDHRFLFGVKKSDLIDLCLSLYGHDNEDSIAKLVEKTEHQFKEFIYAHFFGHN